MGKINLKESRKKRVFPVTKKEKKELLEDKSWVSQIVWNLREHYLKVKK